MDFKTIKYLLQKLSKKANLESQIMFSDDIRVTKYSRWLLHYDSFNRTWMLFKLEKDDINSWYDVVIINWEDGNIINTIIEQLKKHFKINTWTCEKNDNPTKFSEYKVICFLIQNELPTLTCSSIYNVPRILCDILFPEKVKLIVYFVLKSLNNEVFLVSTISSKPLSSPFVLESY